jgi:hypothetical protein
MTLIHALAPVDRLVVLLYLEGLDAAAIGEVTGSHPAPSRQRFIGSRPFWPVGFREETVMLSKPPTDPIQTLWQMQP